MCLKKKAHRKQNTKARQQIQWEKRDFRVTDPPSDRAFRLYLQYNLPTLAHPFTFHLPNKY